MIADGEAPSAVTFVADDGTELDTVPSNPEASLARRILAHGRSADAVLLLQGPRTRSHHRLGVREPHTSDITMM